MLRMKKMSGQQLLMDRKHLKNCTCPITSSEKVFEPHLLRELQLTQRPQPRSSCGRTVSFWLCTGQTPTTAERPQMGTQTQAKFEEYCCPP